MLSVALSFPHWNSESSTSSPCCDERVRSHKKVCRCPHSGVEAVGSSCLRSPISILVISIAFPFNASSLLSCMMFTNFLPRGRYAPAGVGSAAGRVAHTPAQPDAHPRLHQLLDWIMQAWTELLSHYGNRSSPFPISVSGPTRARTSIIGFGHGTLRETR